MKREVRTWRERAVPCPVESIEEDPQLFSTPISFVSRGSIVSNTTLKHLTTGIELKFFISGENISITVLSV